MNVTIPRVQQCIKNVLNFTRSIFLFYRFFCKCGSFRIIGLNVKFSLRGQLKIAAILKVQLTSTFANRVKNSPQDVPFHMNHVTFGLQGKGRVYFHSYAELDYAQATR